MTLLCEQFINCLHKIANILIVVFVIYAHYNYSIYKILEVFTDFANDSEIKYIKEMIQMRNLLFSFAWISTNVRVDRIAYAKCRISK